MSSWETELFRPFDGKDVGVRCCLQVAFCQPCLWGSALSEAGIEDSLLLTLLVLCGGDTLCDEGAGYVARRRIIRKYSIEETESVSLILSCCCAPCARYQELNHLLVRERRTYGLLETIPDPPPPQKAPVPSKMVRSAESARRVRR